MRLLLDTNVLIASLIARGFCSDLFEHCIRHHQLITSKFMTKEFQDKLISKFHFSKKEVLEISKLIFSRMDKVSSRPIEKIHCPDPDDEKVLATALHGKVVFLITGDKELLKLRKVKDVQIVSPREFWRMEPQFS